MTYSISPPITRPDRGIVRNEESDPNPSIGKPGSTSTNNEWDAATVDNSKPLYMLDQSEIKCKKPNYYKL